MTPDALALLVRIAASPVGLHEPSPRELQILRHAGWVSRIGRWARLTTAGRLRCESAGIAMAPPSTLPASRPSTGLRGQVRAVIAAALGPTPRKTSDLAALAGCSPRRVRQVAVELGAVATPFGWRAKEAA